MRFVINIAHMAKEWLQSCMAVLFFVSITCELDRYIEDTDRFPGWKGELPRAMEESLEDSVGFAELGKVSSAYNS